MIKCSYFSNSGSDANEGTIKLAYRHSGKRDYILNSDISFHGKKLVASNVNSRETKYFSFQELVKSDNFEFNNFGSLKKSI